MLTKLHIENYALIRELELDLDSGFTVMTGETGAGKSILLGALGLIMGQRADAHSISEGEEKCVVEATFEQTRIRREVMQNGKSRAQVNGEAVTLSELRDVTRQLIDIHSQHQNLLLHADTFQLHVLDTLAQNTRERDTYTRAYETYKETAQQLHQLEHQATTAQADADYVRYQYQQLADAQLTDGELADLEQELEHLNHIGEIKTALSQVSQGLNDEEQSLLQRLKQLSQTMRSIQDYLQEAQEMSERLQSAQVELDDLVQTAEQLNDRQDFDPQRQQWVTERVDQLNTLLQKYHARDENELIQKRDQLDEQLQHLDNYDQELEDLRKQLKEAQTTLQHAGGELSKTRQAVTKALQQHMQQMLADLGIQHPQFEARISPLTEPDESGMDHVQFRFAANKNQQMQPLSDVASGGELSRVMLCIKSLLAQTQQLPTLLLDEIDTGVSGRVAEQMGQLMTEMGRHMQLVAITHLPQLAAKGQHHLLVYKQDTQERTETHIRALTSEERVEEIAKMMSGSQLTNEALRAAERLCNH